MKNHDKDIAEWERNSARHLAERRELLAEQRAKAIAEIKAGPERDRRLADLDAAEECSEGMHRDEMARIHAGAQELQKLKDEKERIRRMGQFRLDVIEGRLASDVGPRAARVTVLVGVTISNVFWAISRFLYNLFPFRRKTTS